MIALLLMLGCDAVLGTSAAVDLSPAALVGTECEVCGMIVSEQPSPRGQVVYRDGTRAFFCSLGEQRAALQARSPHGRPVKAHVEVVPLDFDPATTSVLPLPWVDAEKAWYVFGTERPLVMGLPVLSFPNEADATQVADRLGLRAVPWPAFRDIPFHQIPE
jgi:copper chaperone NosL